MKRLPLKNSIYYWEEYIMNTSTTILFNLLKIMFDDPIVFLDFTHRIQIELADQQQWIEKMQQYT